MKLGLSISVVAAGIFVFATGADADCVGRPNVPSKNVAAALYRVIAHGRGDLIERTNKIVVEDDGDYWEVVQYPKHIPPPYTSNGVVHVTVVAGGGTLQLRIAKCDGAITEANYAR